MSLSAVHHTSSIIVGDVNLHLNDSTAPHVGPFILLLDDFGLSELVVCGNRNFSSVSVFKKPNQILFVKPYFTVTAVL